MSCAMLPNAAPRIANPAVQPSRAPRWRRHASAWRTAGRAGARRDDPGAEVAAGEERERGGDERRRRATSSRSRTGHRFSASARTCWPQPSGDSHDSQCGPASPIARSANEAPEDGDREPVGSARGVRDLRGDGGDTREDEPDGRERRPERERTGDVQSGGGGRERDDHAERDAGQGGDAQRGGERRVAADGARPDELGAPALLLRARVARDEQDRHQAGERERDPAEAPADEPADRVRVDPAVQRERGGRLAERGDDLAPRRGVLVEVRVRGGGDEHRQPEPEDPPGQHHAVAPEREPQQLSQSRHSGAGTALRGWADGRRGSSRPRARGARARPAARPARPARAPAPSGVSASIVIRVRCRSSASVPVSTVRPARMIVTRSHSASTSDRMWLESSTVRPARALVARRTRGTPPPSAGPARTSARRGSAARRRTRSAATSATFCRLPFE